jgi:Protein of unknown function (DUF2946)
VCFVVGGLLHFKAKWFVAAAARGLAGAFAVGLLLLELVAANGEFHQALHQSGQAAPDRCVLCLFVKGHVGLAQAAPVVTVSVQTAFEPPPRLESIPVVDFTYLASPSRAPPAFPSRLVAVA